MIQIETKDSSILIKLDNGKLIRRAINVVNYDLESNRIILININTERVLCTIDINKCKLNNEQLTISNADEKLSEVLFQ